MRQWWKQKRRHTFHGPKSPHPLQPESQAGRTPGNPAPIPTAPAKRHDTADKERDILSRVQATPRQESNDKNRSQTVAVIDGVIQITEEQYKRYQQGGIRIHRSTGEDIDLRMLSRKILNAALSFKDIVNTVVSFDPTHHAAGAWAVISLGLSVRSPKLNLREED
ncbi:uncharacterized protein CDV56_101549 [Aspergillus thermomutatus]|uniref:Uncharacterized protein n=1 Tax=Aspergillus thermomutatus TaxID=41047 RepID=A0A397G5L4_ASPTH|nr:uncharacterized protein CDV56_101549 [Aspergillus thermomutatus]RHZ45339.1 hypothetical protein CDV56_101549 [Aspergillus thermomutatus]